MLSCEVEGAAHKNRKDSKAQKITVIGIDWYSGLLASAAPNPTIVPNVNKAAEVGSRQQKM